MSTNGCRILSRRAMIVLAAVTVIAGCNEVPSPERASTAPTTQRGGATDANGNPINQEEGEGGVITPPDTGNDQGFVPLRDTLFCGDTGRIVLSKGQSTTLTWSFQNGYVPPTALQFSLQSDPSGASQLGAITPISVLSATYTAPATIPVPLTISIIAHLEDSSTPAVCQVHLLEDGGLGIPDDGQTRGLVGQVYELPANTQMLPDLSLLTPVSDIVTPNLDVPTRSFSMGFPGVPDLFEWFAIRFRGRLVVPAAGVYQFALTSDDGAVLTIDNIEVIDNDGVHAPLTYNGSISLAAGNATIQVDYFQGPRYHIALQLAWKGPGESTYTIIPPDNFLRPL